MPSMVWAAQDVSETRRFDYYRAALCASFVKLSPERPSGVRAFNAHVHLHKTARRAFTFMKLPDHIVRRTGRDASDAGDDFLYLNYVLAGRMTCVQGEERFLAPLGHAVMLDNARPFVADIGAGAGVQLLVCKIPRTLGSATSESMTARVNRHPLFPALAHLIRHAACARQDWDDEDIETTGMAVDALLRSMTRADEESASPSSCADTMRRARAVVRAEIANADLSVDDTARELKLTKRTLQSRLAQCGTTFTKLLAEERCLAVDRLRLRHPEAAVSELFRQVGYTDASTFYRAYQRTNGRPPSRQRSGV